MVTENRRVREQTMELNRKIGYRLSNLMYEHGYMNTCDLEKLSGVSTSHISRLLNEQTKAPRLDTIEKFCEGFDISIYDFFNCECFKKKE